MKLRLAAAPIALALVALSSCSVTSNDAVSISGGNSLSVRDLEDRVEAIAELDPSTWMAESGAVDGDFSRLIVTTWVRGELLQAALADMGESVTAEDTATAQATVEGDPALAKADDDTRAWLIGIIAPGQAVNRIGADDPDAANELVDSLRTVDVKVNTRYGTWDSEQLAAVPAEYQSRTQAPATVATAQE